MFPRAFTLTLMMAVVTPFIVNGQSSDLKQLVETERAFANAALNQSVKQAFQDFFTDDGVVFQPGPVKAREFWDSQPESPALLAWHPVWADISTDGTIGYTTGPWEFKPTGKDGTAVAFGQYITLWQKQSDRSFKAVLDMGITHAKPEAVTSEWDSPKPAESKTEAAADKPTLKLLSHSDYETLLTDDARLYRLQKMPIVGRAQALKQLKTELDVVVKGKITETQCAGSGELMYCYGTLELTKTDGSKTSGNLLRIFKFRDGKWKIVLEVFDR